MLQERAAGEFSTVGLIDLDAERRILHKVEETRQIGASTLAQLHVQHEQLDRVATAQDEVAANLATSERLLRGME